MLSSSRRDFFKTLVGGAAGLSLARRVFAAQESTSLQAVRLTDNVVQITGAGGNIVVLAQPSGLLLVNGGAPERSAELTKFLDTQFPGQRVQALFNTDWHRDHTGLNETVGKAGAKIIAHENTKQYLNEEILVRWQNRTYKPLPKAALPNETFYTTGTMTFGAEEVRYGYLGQAHTDGDMYVYLPGPNLLMAGDVVTVGSYPILDYSTGGWIGGITTAARTLLGLANEQTRIVPGIGAVQPRTHLQAESDMLSAMRERLVKLIKSGLSIDEMLAAAPTKDFDAVWGNPELFIRNSYPGLWWHARELGGII